MKIISLELKNFRSLYDFNMNFDSNFNSFIGDNGSGKSTLREGILYALFGVSYFIESDVLKDKIKSKQDAVELCNSKHRHEEIYSKIALERNENLSYVVTRSITFDNTTANDEVYTIKEIDKRNGGLSKDISLEAFAEIYPSEFCAFSIIHGERLNSITSAFEGTDRNQRLKEDVEKMAQLTDLKYKLKVLDNAKNVMNRRISENEKTSDKLREGLKTLENAEESMRYINLALEELLVDEEKLEKKIAKQDMELNEIEDYDKLNKSIESHKKEKNDLESSFKKQQELIKDLATKNFYKITMKEFAEINFYNNKKEGTEAIPGITQDGIDYITSCNLCICGNEINSAEYDRLIKIRENQPPENIYGSIRATVEKYATDLEEFDDRYDKELENLHDIKIKIGNKTEELKNLTRMAKNCANDNEKRVIYDQIQSDRETLGSIRAEIKTKKDELDTQKMQINIYSENVENLKIKEGKSDKNSHIDSLIKTAFSQLGEEIKDIEEDIRSFLETSVNKIIGDVLGNAVAITIEKNNNFIPKLNFKSDAKDGSDGQNEVISMCYLFGLMKTVKMIDDKYNDIINMDAVDYPIVLDAVFGKLDETNIDSIMNLINEYKGQIIMMNTNTMHNAIKNKLPQSSKIHVVENDENQAVSVFKEVQ